MKRRGPWQQKSSRELHQTPWITLTTDDVITPADKPGHYTYIQTNPFILIIAVNDANEMLIIEQYRYPIEQESWEFPAGAIDADETIEQAAKRELGEEAGLKAGEMRELGTIYESVSHADSMGTVLLASQISQAPELLLDEEGITHHLWVSRKAFELLIADGTMRDSKSMAAFALLQVDSSLRVSSDIIPT